MWQSWKIFFAQVLDKHAPIRVKRLRKRGNVPWVNSEVKEKLFKRDALKRKAIKTHLLTSLSVYSVNQFPKTVMRQETTSSTMQ
jgi:hypothetical protein